MSDTTPDADADALPSRPRRARTVTETLGSIVLACEILVVFLAALVAFGLNAIQGMPPVFALVAGGILCVALIVAIGLLRRRSGRILGWILQAIIVATGFFLPAMFFIGALFAAMWAYSMITGQRIDRQKESV